MRKAIVLGATGLVGSQVVRVLAESDQVEQIIAVTRRPVNYAVTEMKNKVVNQVVNFDRLPDFSDLLQGDALFSCLGTTRKQAGSLEAQRLVDFDHQYSCAAMAADNGVEHYLLVSSSGANASSFSPYLKMKGELEHAIERLPFKRISVFQPSLLLGNRPQSRRAEDLGSVVLPTLCKLPGLKRFRPIEGALLARRMVEVSLRQETGHQLFRLADCFPD